MLNKDANIENTKSEGEAKREDAQYGKPNQQCQKHQKVIDETKTKEKEKENQDDKISAEEEEKNNENTSKTNEPEAKHFKLYQENLESRKIEHKLKEEEQTENRQQLKGDDTQKKQKQVAKRTNKKNSIRKK